MGYQIEVKKGVVELGDGFVIRQSIHGAATPQEAIENYIRSQEEIIQKAYNSISQAKENIFEAKSLGKRLEEK